MRPLDFIKELPPFATMSPMEILAHPAWGIAQTVSGKACLMKADGIAPAEAFSLKVRFGKEECVLSLAPCRAMPEFSKLLAIREQVPEAVLLAVLESEAGMLFQMLEDAVRIELSIGSPTDSPGASPVPFRLLQQEEGNEYHFTLAMTPPVLATLGTLEHLDLTHPSIADIPLEAEVEYAVFDLSPEEEAGLAVGDCLLLPELSGEKPGRIVLRGKGDSKRLRILADTTRHISFADYVAADGMPRCDADTDALLLLKAGARRASGHLVKLGVQNAMQLEAIC